MMNIVALLYIVWTFQLSFGNDDYRVFEKRICAERCETITCPLRTVMKIERVKVSYAKCNDIEREGPPDNYRNNVNECHKVMQKEFGEKTDSNCSNKSTCVLCHNWESKVQHESCIEPEISTVSFICISDSIFDEVVPPNSYLDLSCEHIVGQRIVIRKATLIPKVKDIERSEKQCQVTDVTTTISGICSRKSKCQAGPNSIIPNNCSSRNLNLSYSCVSQLALNIDNSPSRIVLPFEPQAASTNHDKSLKDPSNGKESKKHKHTPSEADLDRVWIITVLSLVFVLVVAFVSIAYWYRYKHHLSESSLAAKVKLANFGPPPSSIDKIEIDLNSDNRVLLKATQIYPILNGYAEDDYDFWKSTLSRYTTDNVRIDVPSCSMSAGSSGQMSTYQSESSKGNTSAVCNHTSRD